jgi:hypothetical protein
LGCRTMLTLPRAGEVEVEDAWEVDREDAVEVSSEEAGEDGLEDIVVGVVDRDVAAVACWPLGFDVDNA